jgi:uncharacterized protein Usg
MDSSTPDPTFPGLPELERLARFPEVSRFLDFWRRQIVAPLHSVRVASAALTRPAELRYAGGQFVLHSARTLPAPQRRL